MHALETQKPIAALAQSFDWSDLTKRSALTTPQKGGHFSCGKPLPHAGAPIVLHGHIPDFTSSSEGGIWSCRGLDPVFQEVLWPRWSSEPQIAGSSPARIIELLLEEVIALCSRAAEACSKQGSGIRADLQCLSVCMDNDRSPYATASIRW